MLSRLTISLAVALASCSAVAAVVCGVCAPTISVGGTTRHLTLATQEAKNDLQCSYDGPAISGFAASCLYRNSDGVLIFGTAGNACPDPIHIVTKSSC
ncbi:unnamed protein product [Mycena citricolor]|uniref:Uncharacterized protein n=1 Tax=Mycena citricolor TaxID=2018698 RepID=A0AAD2HJ77_9AGAR|nr:unnamed protein product [Mycena citricolor]CAK5276300.1 unnamed protein product [Mycena citricolor]